MLFVTNARRSDHTAGCRPPPSGIKPALKRRARYSSHAHRHTDAERTAVSAASFHRHIKETDVIHFSQTRQVPDVTYTFPPVQSNPVPSIDGAGHCRTWSQGTVSIHVPVKVYFYNKSVICACKRGSRLTSLTLCVTAHVRKTRDMTWNPVRTTEDGTIPETRDTRQTVHIQRWLAAASYLFHLLTPEKHKLKHHVSVFFLIYFLKMFSIQETFLRNLCIGKKYMKVFAVRSQTDPHKTRDSWMSM